MGFSRRFAAACVATALAALACASVGSASTYNPTGEWAPFGECPLSRATITNCFHLSTTSGTIQFGSKTVPLKNPLTLQGGFEGEEPIEFFGAENGATLPKVAEPVPGGLAGTTAPLSWPEALQEWWNEGIAEGLTGVSATLELAAPATAIEIDLENLLLEEETAIRLPVKIHLDNALLGSECYVGSNSSPLVLHLTTGSSGGLTGAAGTFSFNGGFTLFTFTGVELVDGTFAAPETNGCGGAFSADVDPFLSSLLGLPAEVFKNSLELEGDLKIGDPGEVWAHAM